MLTLGESVVGSIIELFFQLGCRFEMFQNGKLVGEKRNAH